MKVTDVKTFNVDCFRTNWVFVKVYTDEHAIIGTSGEILVKSRVSALVPFNFFVKGKYNFI